MIHAFQALDGVDDPTIILGTQILGTNQVRLELKDNGSVIAEEDIERIFEYYSTTKNPGGRLRLSNTDGILRYHRGSTYIRSEPGAGTNFVLELPTGGKAAVLTPFPRRRHPL